MTVCLLVVEYVQLFEFDGDWTYPVAELNGCVSTDDPEELPSSGGYRAQPEEEVARERDGGLVNMRQNSNARRGKRSTGSLGAMGAAVLRPVSGAEHMHLPSVGAQAQPSTFDQY